MSTPGQWELDSILVALELTTQERIQALALLPTSHAIKLTRQQSSLVPFHAEDLGSLPVLGDLLKSMRLRSRMTQQQMARELKTTRSTILRWEAAETMPSQENLERICVLLKAHTEESAALSSRQLQFGEDTFPVSIETLAEQVTALESQGGRLQSPLIDLQALALKRHLWMLADKSQEALRLLGHVQVIHANWLVMQMRRQEAEPYLKHSLTILKKKFTSDRFLQSAVNLAANLAYQTRGGSATSVKLLKHWLPVAPKQLQTTMWCDIALYVANIHQHDAAAYYLSRARDTLPHSLDTEWMSTYYYPLTYARILLKTGRPLEALAWLPALPNTAPHTLHTVLQFMWAETLLEAGEADMAQRYMDQLAISLRDCPQPHLMHKFQKLSTHL